LITNLSYPSNIFQFQENLMHIFTLRLFINSWYINTWVYNTIKFIHHTVT